MLSFGWHPSPIIVAAEYEKAAVEIETTMIVPMRESIPIAAAAVERRFIAQGPGWHPWAESYEAYARAHNQGILWQSGDLATSQSDPGNYQASPHTLVFTGGSLPGYWEFHQEGTSKMVERPFVGLDAEAEGEIYILFDRWLQGIVGA